MGSAALVFTMGRFLIFDPWTLGLVAVFLIALVNTNTDINQMELGQSEEISEGLLTINQNELRWKRAAKEGQKSKGKKTKRSQKRSNKAEGNKSGKKKKKKKGGKKKKKKKKKKS